MSYTPNEWQTGDVVTAEKLNHMENGIADAGPLMIHVDGNGTMDKTWQEIFDKFSAGSRYLIDKSSEGFVAFATVIAVASDPEQGYAVNVLNTDADTGTNTIQYFLCDTPTDYPVRGEG